MQSVLVLPLVVPPQVEAAAEPTPSAEGAFLLSFAAEEENAPASKDSADPSPPGAITGLPFPMAFSLPLLPEDPAPGLMLDAGIGLAVEAGAETPADAEPKDIALPSIVPVSVASPSDAPFSVEDPPPGLPPAIKLTDAAGAEVPQVRRGDLSPVAIGAVLNAQPRASDGTPAPSGPPLQGATGRDVQDMPNGPHPEARAAEPDGRLVPEKSSLHPTLTATVPSAVQRSEAAHPQPIEAPPVHPEPLSEPGQPVLAPDQPSAPAYVQSVAAVVAAKSLVDERPDGVPRLQSATLPAGQIVVPVPTAMPAEDSAQVTTPSPSPASVVPAATGSPVVPTAREPVLAPDPAPADPAPADPAPAEPAPAEPAPSSALPDAFHPGGGDERAATLPAPVQPLPTPVPGFWERLFSGLVVPLSDEGAQQKDEKLEAVPFEATASPRDVKTVPLTVPAPSEAAAVALFARGQAQALKPETDTSSDEVPASAFLLASSPGSLAAAAPMLPSPQSSPTLLAVPQVAGQIAAALSQTSDGATELALSPEELGHVRLKLERDAKHPERMIVHITFERPETLDLFRRHAGELAEALRDAGFAGADIGFGQQGGGSNEFNRGEESRTLAGAASGGPAEPLRPEPSSPRLMAGASLDLRL